MSSPTVIEPGDGRTILLFVAHADDPALFLGGTILRWADAGWRVVCVRVTDDRFDSVGLTEAETIPSARAAARNPCALRAIVSGDDGTALREIRGGDGGTNSVTDKFGDSALY